MSAITIIASIATAGGTLHRVEHDSSSVKGRMTFAIFLPPQATTQKVPVLWWLSGLTCTDENFSQKAGAFKKAAELGLALVMPDTSPRGLDLPGEHDSYDFGSGAGFYVNATVAPWSEHYRMYDYVVSELPALIRAHFPINDKQSISGHSMGGHGALIIALKNPAAYASVSAFAPIVNPSDCPWGQKAFTGYLGPRTAQWDTHDTCALINAGARVKHIFVDQGLADNFLTEQLKPDALRTACTAMQQPLTLRTHADYDHSYYFISTFIDEHLDYHARALNQ